MNDIVLGVVHRCPPEIYAAIVAKRASRYRWPFSRMQVGEQVTYSNTDPEDRNAWVTARVHAHRMRQKTGRPFQFHYDHDHPKGHITITRIE